MDPAKPQSPAPWIAPAPYDLEEPSPRAWSVASHPEQATSEDPWWEHLAFPFSTTRSHLQTLGWSHGETLSQG